jgi:FecR protein
MKPTMQDDGREAMLTQLGTLAREAWSDSGRPGAASAGKRQLRATLDRSRTRRVRRNVAFTLVAAAAVAAGVALFFLRRAPLQLAYSVDSPSPSAGGYLQGSERAAAVAHFTDGTEVRVEKASRARIVDVESRGARVALEQGRARLRVVHRADARWSVDAGPFSIAVTGTEFDVDWSAADGVLVVEMRAGGVVVRGPLAVDGIGVHAGQRLVASLPESRLHIEPLGEPMAARPDVPGEPARPEVPFVPPDRGEPRPAVERAAPPASWGKRVAGGDFRSVLAEAGAAWRSRRSGGRCAIHWQPGHCARRARGSAEALSDLHRCESRCVFPRSNGGGQGRDRRGDKLV